MIRDHNQKNRNNIIIFSLIWVIAVGILILSLFQNLGYAKVINYSGIVRGATQRLIKKEVAGKPDDDLISYLDDILYDLSSGEGTYDLVRISDTDYQQQISDMRKSWKEMKKEITNVRSGADSERLLSMSEDYYYAANNMVHAAELYSNHQFYRLIGIFCLYILVSMTAFVIWYRFKQKQLRSILYFDELTGICNHTAFEILVSKALDKHHGTLALICLDINDFKFLNSSYGYTFGDDILCFVASALKTIALHPEYCARSGADRFYLLCSYREDIMEYINTYLLEEISKQSQLDITEDITFSMGGLLIQEETNVRSILDLTDLAHKSAKADRLHSYVWYDNALTNRLMDENQKLKRLHRGILQEDFLVYFQPKFRMDDNSIIGAEALVRWQYDSEHLLYPDEFIELFERNGVIYELDYFMLNKVCCFIQEHSLHKRDFIISVNFSRVTLYRKDFLEYLYSTLRKYQIPASCLEIEITETVINGLSDPIITLLQELRNHGFLISIDDFGTGYSSFSLLSSLPIDILKIDKDFLLDKRNELNLRNVLELIIRVAHTLGIHVICEGVETEESVKLLRELSCDYGQGYYISKPICAKDFTEAYL